MVFEIYLFNKILKCISKCVAVTYHVFHLAFFYYSHHGGIRGVQVACTPSIFAAIGRLGKKNTPNYVNWLWKLHFFLCFSGGTSPSDIPKSCQSSILGTLSFKNPGSASAHFHVHPVHIVICWSQIEIPNIPSTDWNWEEIKDVS